MSRTFNIQPAARTRVPLLVGLMGASGSGKTYSALELATGIQSVSGGDIVYIDTEARRALHYADRFKFQHMEFGEPFGSDDYLEAIRFAVSKANGGVIIIDSMSHEHEGPGGMIDMHEMEVDRMSGGSWEKAERVKMLAWQKPKAARRRLINGILQLNANFVFCFRAKETSKPIKKDGKNVVEPMGFMPIAGDEFVFEMTTNILLMPGAKGCPTWNPEFTGERKMTKLPAQFSGMLDDGKQLSRAHGALLATWAKGDTRDYELEGKEAASAGSEALRTWWASVPQSIRSRLTALKDSELKPAAEKADKERAA